MSRQGSAGTYKAFDCGDDCHENRYVSFTTRTWWGSRRWGVVDQHMEQRLTRICRDRLELYHWMAQLRTMELRERWAREDRPRQHA